MGLIIATILGYFTQRIKLSPILGYLLAGYLIGPFSPGFVADLDVSEQLAEIGVILMMFGVGLHLRWQELMHVKAIAITGALSQTLFSTVIGALLVSNLGWSLEASIIIGLSTGIASTVVLARVLSDNNLQNTTAGHISLSWLICEDFLAVIALLLLPTLGELTKGNLVDWHTVVSSLAIIMTKFAIWVVALFTVGKKLISYALNKIIQTRSHELFTLSTLAITFAIAIGTVTLTGTSIALGAFIAGMVIGQTTLRHTISSNLLPLKEVFVVVFFLSIGMLFNPEAVFDNFLIFIIILLIILLGKPFVAWFIVWFFKYPVKTATIVALALAQIGEFSFILAEEASKFKIFPDEGFDIIVACAFISLALNPLVFRLFSKTKNLLSSS
jgi:CPA2 family monovalent cation:H+ antiporter-2